MKAIIQTRYGSSDVLEFREVDQPGYLGLRRDYAEAEQGLGRMIAEQEQFYRGLPASDIASGDWLGWAGGSLGPNPAEVCIGFKG